MFLFCSVCSVHCGGLHTAVSLAAIIDSPVNQPTSLFFFALEKMLPLLSCHKAVIFRVITGFQKNKPFVVISLSSSHYSLELLSIILCGAAGAAA